MSSMRSNSSGRTTSSRRNSSSEKEALILDCKAAYLVLYEDLNTEIESKEDLYKVLQQAGRNPTNRMLSKYWTEKTDTLSFDDFCDICQKEPPTNEEELLKAFRKIDINGDGYISNAELMRVLTTKGEKMTKAEVQEIIDEADENGDGKLDYKEYVAMVMRTHEECKQMALKNYEKKQKMLAKSQQSPRNSKKKERDNDTSSDAAVEEGETSNRSRVLADKSSNARDRRRQSKPSTMADLSGSKASLRSISSAKSSSKPARNSPNFESSSKTAKNISDSDDAKSVASEIEEEENVKNADPDAPDPANRCDKNNRDVQDSDDDDDDDIVIGNSRISLTSKRTVSGKPSMTPIPTPRSSRISRQESDEPLKSLSTSKGKDVREWSKPGVNAKLTLNKPKTLRDWKLASSRGCFYLNDDARFVSHQYNLKIPQDSNAWITIEPKCLPSGTDINSVCEKSGSPVDMILFVLDSDDSVVAFTEERDLKGKYGVACDLKKGSYKLIAFTSGCRFKKRSAEPRAKDQVELFKVKDDKVVLTKAYRDTLMAIFDVCDLTGNGLLSREEFNYLNIQTGEQETEDSEWDVVVDRFETKDDQITKQGFIELSQLEVEDNQDEPDRIWENLEALGYNKSLILDQASPFIVEVYTERGSPTLKVTKLDVGGKCLTNAIVQSITEKSESSRVKGTKDINLHSYVTDFRACLIVQNESNTKCSVTVDCKKSRNIVSHQQSLLHVVEVPPKSAVVAHHFLPIKDSQPWTISCQESLK